MLEPIWVYFSNFFNDHENQLKDSYPGVSLDNLFREFQDYYPQRVERNKLIDSELEQCLDTFFSDLLSGKPIQYITNYAHFFGREFFVNSSVLIPRQETELLIEIASHHLKETGIKASVLDLGAGSGVVGLTLAMERRDLLKNVTLSDICKEALKVTKLNKLKFSYEIDSTIEVKIVESDLFKNINEKFDLIVSNPPYIKRKSHFDLVHPQVSKYEPGLALFVEDDAYDIFFERLFFEARESLMIGGLFLMEGHEAEIDNLSRLWLLNFKLDSVEVLKDLTNQPRFLKVTKGE